jgi:hypothetical protein
MDYAPFRRPGLTTICFIALTLRLDEAQSHAVRRSPQIGISYVVEIPWLLPPARQS